MLVDSIQTTVGALADGDTFFDPANSFVSVKVSLNGGITGTGNPDDRYVTNLSEGGVHVVNKDLAVLKINYKAVPA